MGAGIPGLGLSGLFVLLSALGLPFARRRAPVRRPSSTLFKLAVFMTAITIVLWQAVSGVITLIHPDPSSGHAHRMAGSALGAGPWPVPILLISVALMILVVLGAEALLHLVGVTLTPTPPPVQPRPLAAPLPNAMTAAAWKTPSVQTVSPELQIEPAESRLSGHRSFVN